MMNLNVAALPHDLHGRSLLYGPDVKPNIYTDYPSLLRFNGLTSHLYTAASVVLEQSRTQIMQYAQEAGISLNWPGIMYHVLPDVRLCLNVPKKGLQQVSSGDCITSSGTWGLNYIPGVAVVREGDIKGTYNAAVFKDGKHVPYAIIDGLESWRLGHVDTANLRARTTDVLYEHGGSRGLSKLQQSLVTLLSYELGILNSGGPVWLHEVLNNKLREIGQPVPESNWSVLMTSDQLREYQRMNAR